MNNGRPLCNLWVSVSVSESENTEDLGFPKWQVNRTTLHIVSALFDQGAGVVFGHDWRDDGIMAAVHGFALQKQNTDSEPLLWNVLPWPDQPRMSVEERERLSGTLRVITNERPTGFDGPEQRVRSLTEMRQRLTTMVSARICLGGRMHGYQGNMPGVYEEALMAIRADLPIYLVGLFGGATRMTIDAIERRGMDGLPDLDYLGEVGWTKMDVNGLSRNENRRLFYTLVLEEAINLILTGLGRVRSRKLDDN